MTEELAGHVDDFVDSDRRIVAVDGLEIGVFNVDGAFYAYENRCPHQGGPACLGKIFGRVEAVLAPDRSTLEERFSTTERHLACPWHGWEFDIRTGVCPTAPEYRLEAFEVIKRGDELYLVI